ncbi:peptide deformylase, partial [Salmonella enterica]|uniref:peptide deformylase n=1 Tax=Salmonella enterica TaxID=28901 RepID=UPI003D2B59EB
MPDPVLLLKASEVTKFDKKLWKTIAKMKACLIASHGIGLAAPQMGISERIILLKPSTTNNIRVMINPVITFTHDY